MSGSVYFGKETWFTGRNGLFKARGISMWNDSDGNIVISPITSKDRIANCDIAITRESVSDVIRALLNMCDDIDIPTIWSVDDFESLALEDEETVMEELGMSEKPILYNRYKFSEELKHMCYNHDCDLGITWDTLRSYLDNCKIEKQE